MELCPFTITFTFFTGKLPWKAKKIIQFFQKKIIPLLQTIIPLKSEHFVKTKNVPKVLKCKIKLETRQTQAWLTSNRTGLGRTDFGQTDLKQERLRKGDLKQERVRQDKQT